MTSERKSNASLVTSVLALAISACGAVFSYRSSEAARKNVALQASQVETRVEVVAYLDPDKMDQPILVIEVINLGAPVDLRTLGFLTKSTNDTGKKLTYARQPGVVQQRLPIRLERNSTFQVELGPEDIGDFAMADRFGVTQIVVFTGSGQQFYARSDDIVEYLRRAKSNSEH